MVDYTDSAKVAEDLARSEALGAELQAWLDAGSPAMPAEPKHESVTLVLTRKVNLVTGEETLFWMEYANV